MKAVVDALESAGNEVLLQVHDAVYMKSKAGLSEARMAIKAESKYYTMSCDEIEPYKFVERDTMADIVQEEQDHKARMAQQELLAQNRVWATEDALEQFEQEAEVPQELSATDIEQMNLVLDKMKPQAEPDIGLIMDRIRAKKDKGIYTA